MKRLLSDFTSVDCSELMRPPRPCRTLAMLVSGWLRHELPGSPPAETPQDRSDTNQRRRIVDWIMRSLFGSYHQ